MLKITNLTNSPHDIDVFEGPPLRIGAMATIGPDDFKIAPDYLAQMEGVGFFKVERIDDKAPKPDKVEKKPRVNATAPATTPKAADAPENTDPRTDDELRAVILERTGKKAHHKAGRAKLLAQVVASDPKPEPEAAAPAPETVEEADAAQDGDEDAAEAQADTHEAGNPTPPANEVPETV